jgi:hypothetical protein
MKPKTATNPKGSGRKKSVLSPEKITVTFDRAELEALRNYAKETGRPYSELLRVMVRMYFAMAKTN